MPETSIPKPDSILGKDASESEQGRQGLPQSDTTGNDKSTGSNDKAIEIDDVIQVNKVQGGNDSSETKYPSSGITTVGQGMTQELVDLMPRSHRNNYQHRNRVRVRVRRLWHKYDSLSQEGEGSSSNASMVVDNRSRAESVQQTGTGFQGANKILEEDARGIDAYKPKWMEDEEYTMQQMLYLKKHDMANATKFAIKLQQANEARKRVKAKFEEAKSTWHQAENLVSPGGLAAYEGKELEEIDPKKRLDVAFARYLEEKARVEADSNQLSQVDLKTNPNEANQQAQMQRDIDNHGVGRSAGEDASGMQYMPSVKSTVLINNGEYRHYDNLRNIGTSGDMGRQDYQDNASSPTAQATIDGNSKKRRRNNARWQVVNEYHTEIMDNLMETQDEQMNKLKEQHNKEMQEIQNRHKLDIKNLRNIHYEQQRVALENYSDRKTG